MPVMTPAEMQATANQDYHRGNRFDITMTGALAIGQNVLKHCVQAPIAGTRYGTVEYRNASPLLKLPNDVIYNDIRLVFNNASDGAALDHFKKCNTEKIIPNIKNDYSFNFFDEYTGDIIVRQYNNQNTLTHTTKYINAWVSGVEDIMLDMNNSNVIQLFQVIFTYERLE